MIPAQSIAALNGWTEEAYKRFWHHMGGVFGRPWYEQNGPETTEVWKREVSEISLDRMAATLHHFRLSGDHYPPNLSVFMKTARDIKLRRLDEPQIEHKADSDTIAKSIEKMRSKRSKVRCVFKPDESMEDYFEAIRVSGKSRVEFDQQRLVENGWTEKDEESFINHSRVFKKL